MRLTGVTIILVTALLSIAQAGAVSGQNVLEYRLSLKEKDQPLPAVLKKIQKNAGVNFMYKNADLEGKNKVSFEATNQALGEILSRLLTPAGLEYTAVGNNIVIKRSTVIRASFSDVVVSGLVSSDAGEALPGVNVVVKGTTNGTTTDANGRYTLTAPDNGTLVFSFIGFQTREELVGNRTTIDIQLAMSATQLEDIVVVGYGSAKKSEILGAVSTVSTKEASSRNYNTAAELLQGTVAGVTVLNNGGDPTVGPKIRIRGIGSLNDETPLIILDGVIYVGDFNAINPNDIQSMTVLKDAASAAIYGSRASGGVILINTKEGKADRMHVEVNYQHGVQQVAKKLNALNAEERANAANLAADNAGIARNPAFDPTTNPDSRVTRTVWMDEVFQSGVINNVDLSLQGGNETSNYFISSGYRKNDGIVLNTFSERYTARVNSAHKLAPGVKIGENFTYSLWNGQTANTSSAYTGAILSAIYYPANATIYKQDGSGKFGGVPDQYPTAYGDVINPVAYLKRLDNRAPTSTLLINPYLEWDIIKGLKFRSNWGITRISTNEKQFTTKIPEPGKIFDNNELMQRTDNLTSMLTEQTLTYTGTIGSDHAITVLAGYTYQKDKREFYQVKGTGFDNEDPAYRYLSNAKTMQVLSSGGPESNLMSYLARVNYTYGGRYMFTGVIRRDGTSKLSAAKRWEIYPSASLGWNISNESFMQSTNFISDLKLRASWGIIGNLGSLPEYPYSIALTPTRTWLGADPSIAYGYAELELSNKDLKWERSEQRNIGLDFGLLEGHLSGSFDVFKKINDRMLFRQILPGTSGTPNGRFINGGTVNNKGIELALTYKKTDGPLTFDITGNVARVKNEVEYITDDNKFQNVGTLVRNLPYPNINIVGSSSQAFYGYQTAGIFQTDAEAAEYVNTKGVRYQPNAKAGDFKFVDENNDGSINDSDRKILGNPFPKMTYSLNGNFNFKRFDLNIFFQGVQGNSIFNAVKGMGLNATYGYNLLDDARNAWTPENHSNSIPKLSITDPNNNFGRMSDFYVEDASFLRLKSVTLGYTFTTEKVSDLKVRVYITGQNLFTITNYSGMDPEVGITNNGIDVGLYPLSRVYMAGINVKF